MNKCLWSVRIISCFVIIIILLFGCVSSSNNSSTKYTINTVQQPVVIKSEIIQSLLSDKTIYGRDESNGNSATQFISQDGITFMQFLDGSIDKGKWYINNNKICFTFRENSSGNCYDIFELGQGYYRFVNPTTNTRVKFTISNGDIKKLSYLYFESKNTKEEKSQKGFTATESFGILLGLAGAAIGKSFEYTRDIYQESASRGCGGSLTINIFKQGAILREPLKKADITIEGPNYYQIKTKTEGDGLLSSPGKIDLSLLCAGEYKISSPFMKDNLAFVLGTNEHKVIEIRLY